MFPIALHPISIITRLLNAKSVLTLVKLAWVLLLKIARLAFPMIIKI